MREITPLLTPDLLRHFGDPPDVVHRPPFAVARYRDLIEHIAKLSYLNKDHLLFFRGQDDDYTGRGGGTSLYPTIYRSPRLRREEVRQKFSLLERAGRRLHKLFDGSKIDGHQDLGRRKTIQWAIIQHYGVCDTPLLDLTHSPRVACSFAQHGNVRPRGVVYVLGLPHITNRISVNSEHDLINVRLLSICPPAALRPYFQEGYLAGTADITTEYEPKSELDFNRRLIAKFSIPTDETFWTGGLSRVPSDELYPPEDKVEELCRHLDLTKPDEAGPPSVSEFLAAWVGLEQLLVGAAQRQQDRIPTVKEALRVLATTGMIDPWYQYRLEKVREARNRLVHDTERIHDIDLTDLIADAVDIRAALEDKLNPKRRRAT